MVDVGGVEVGRFVVGAVIGVACVLLVVVDVCVLGVDVVVVVAGAVTLACAAVVVADDGACVAVDVVDLFGCFCTFGVSRSNGGGDSPVLTFADLGGVVAVVVDDVVVDDGVVVNRAVVTGEDLFAVLVMTGCVLVFGVDDVVG